MRHERRRGPSSIWLAAVVAVGPMVLASVLGAASRRGAPEADAIPVFARKYRTSCSTCHTAAPKLNVLGEAFRLNGYRFPENEALLRKEEPVPLGAEPWKEEWPRAIWPGEVPGAAPLALRIVSDVQVTRDERVDYDWTYHFPNELYVLSGGSLGERIGFFVEVEWTPEDGIEVVQAKVPFQDPLPFLPPRALNIWVGKQNLYLFTLGDRQIDRAGRQRLLWSSFASSDFDLRDRATGDVLRSENDLQLRRAQPAVEVNGLVRRRLFYAIGVSQGRASSLEDNNERKDLYFKLRYKLGGLALDGTFDDAGAPVLGTGGQLYDRSLIVELFAYSGSHPVASGREDAHRTWGVAARWLRGPLDLGAGYAWGRNENPWGLSPAAETTHWSAFGKAEYFVFPWLMGSFKAEKLEGDLREPRPIGFEPSPPGRTRVLPGVVFLVRQNVRGVVEGEIYTHHATATEAGVRKPHNLWLRLDVAF